MLKQDNITADSQRNAEIHRSITMTASEITRANSTQEEALTNLSSDKDHTTNERAGAGRVEVAVLAGGCFWGVEDLLRDVPGVIGTEVGYTGGWLENPTYEDTHDGRSGHAEAVRVTFDPSGLSFEGLL